MARRRKDESLVNVLYGIFMRIPTWMCVPIAIFAFCIVSGLIGGIAARDPRLASLASLGNFAGGGLAVIILLAGFKAFVERAARQKILANQSGIESIRALSWSQFELLVGQIFRERGYDVMEQGGNSPDGGVDLKLRRDGRTTIVQCKQWRSWKVGVSVVREVFGVQVSEAVDESVIVTSGIFTDEAKEFAKGKPIQLIDGTELCRLIEQVRGQSNTASPATLPVAELKCASDPRCPECQSGMELRTAKRGANAGSQFWGCVRYPKCRGIREFVDLNAI